MNNTEKDFIQIWGFNHVKILPTFINEQIDFLHKAIEADLKTGEVFISKGILSEQRKNYFLEKHNSLPAQMRKPFARWVYDQAPNDKALQDSKNKIMAIMLKLPYLASMPQITTLLLDTVKELEADTFRSECKSFTCLPFSHDKDDIRSLYLGFGSEDKLKEYRQLGPQVRSKIKDLENLYGESNTYYFITEEDTVVAELGSASALSNVETGSKVLLERNLKQHEIAHNWAELFNEAIKLGGTDIHCDPSIIPNDDSVSIKIRVDGNLTKVSEHKFILRHSIFREMIGYLHSATGAGELGSTIMKPASGMVFDYVNIANTMRIKMRPEFAPLGVKDASGKELVRLVLRVWVIKDSTQSLEDLNVQREALEYIQQIIKRDDGLILTAGPTGSGKSTLMGAILDAQANYDDDKGSILSFEDPIEQISGSLVQIQLTDSMRMSIERGDADELSTRKNMLKSFLRQDPDKIYIGEIRDSMTADFAGDIASSGHKTFATFHATSPEDALVRLSAKLQGSTASLVQFFTSLSCIITTSLIAAPCPECSYYEEISPEDAESLKFKFSLTTEQLDKLTATKIVLNSGKNADQSVCSVCLGKGVKGRKPVLGIFNINRDIKMKLLDLSDSTRFIRATENPAIDMRDSIVNGLISGKISINALIKNRQHFTEISND